MPASVYGHNFAVKFQSLQLENYCYVYKLHRFVPFFCFVQHFKMRIGFSYFSSEAEHVLAFFLFFWENRAAVSLQSVFLYKNRNERNLMSRNFVGET